MSLIAQKLISASGLKEETDPDFNLVTGLYHFDGSNGAQNNTFVDSSSTSKTLTCSSNLAQGTFSPFSADEGKWSSSFAAVNPGIDYLSIPASADFAFGTGDYTIEAFVYKRSTGQQSIYDGRGGTNTNRVLFYVNSANKLANYINADVKGAATSDFPLNQWVHVALVRSGTTGYMFQNGTQVATWSGDTVNVAEPDTAGLYIGQDTRSSYSYPWHGFISNLRVLKGTALYTGSYTTPTSPLTAITNTKLLTCCSNRHRDKSTSAHVVTSVNAVSNNSGPAIQPFSPFAPSASYNAATKGGSANWPIETDKTNKITLSSSADFAFGTGAFTIDCWVYVTADTNPYSRVCHVGPFWNDNNAIGIVVNDTAESEKTTFDVYAAGGRTCVSTNVTPRNEWTHIACVRDSSGNFKLFINGNLDATNTSYTSTDISPGGNQTLAIGNIVETSASLEAEAQFEGYISNFRVVKGTAIYSSSFTPPTAPTTDVTNTKLLANFTNAAMFDQSQKTNVLTVGNAQLDTSVKKFGTASAEFDHSGDYLTLPYSTFILFGTGDFTIECWAYFVSTPNGNGQGLFQLSNAYLNAQVRGPAAGAEGNNGKWTMFAGTTQYTHTSVPSINTWYHVAQVRNSGTTKLYIDGTEILSASDSTNYTDPYFLIGGWYTTDYLMDGFIDEFRVSRKARYTSNFTPPTEEFANR